MVTFKQRTCGGSSKPTPTHIGGLSFSTIAVQARPRGLAVGGCTHAGLTQGNIGTTLGLCRFSATTLQPGMTSPQQLSLAQILKATDPGKILELFRNHRLAHEFVSWALDPNMPRPPQLEDLLCPIVTPGLIPIEGLSARMGGTDFLRSEQIQIIQAFVGCYYARSATSTLEVIQRAGADMLQVFISNQGRFLEI